jgi:hypothetical protein
MTETLQIEFMPSLPVGVERRIRAARESGQLTDCQRDVLRLMVSGMRPAIGGAQAISIADMQSIWRERHELIHSDRTIKAAMKGLLEDWNIPVGSSRRSTCPGYFLLADDSEVQSTVRVYLAEAKSLLRRCKALSPGTDFVRGLLGQETLGEEL